MSDWLFGSAICSYRSDVAIVTSVKPLNHTKFPLVPRCIIMNLDKITNVDDLLICTSSAVMLSDIPSSIATTSLVCPPWLSSDWRNSNLGQTPYHL